MEVISCYEAGYDGFWLHRLLEAQGVHNHVIDPASLQVDRRARRAKTDGIDVGKLLRSLMAYLRGEPKVWSVVHVPTVIEEDNRRLHRERSRLTNERIQHVNRIKGLLAIHGISMTMNPCIPNGSSGSSDCAQPIATHCHFTLRQKFSVSCSASKSSWG